MNQKLFIFLILVLGTNLLCAKDASELLAEYNMELRGKFPDVKIISTADLAAMPSTPLLLDARAPKEFAVSHLPGARLVESDPLAQLRNLGVTKDHPVVVYCSVGYRSALLVQKLTRAGYTQVSNLEGSIFAWANEERPLQNNKGPTHVVHPFNKEWGRFLSKPKWRWVHDDAASR